MKLSPAASIATSASPAPGRGSGSSSRRNASGSPGSWTRIAFMNDEPLLRLPRSVTSLLEIALRVGDVVLVPLQRLLVLTGRRDLVHLGLVEANPFAHLVTLLALLGHFALLLFALPLLIVVPLALLLPPAGVACLATIVAI